MCIYSVTKEENRRIRGKKITEGNVPEIKGANHRLKGVFPQESTITLINYNSNNNHLYLRFSGSISFNPHNTETLSISAFSIVLKLN